MSNTSELLAYNPDLVGNHMHAIAEFEARQPFDAASPELIEEDPVLYETGILVAEACLHVGAGRRRAATSLLDEARDRVQEIYDEPESFDRLVPYHQIEDQIDLYRNWTRSFVRSSLREQRITEARTSLQSRTITDLGHYALMSKQDRDNVKIGTIAELATVGILERQQHPWHLTTTALPHHDQGGKAHLNFDTLTSVSAPDREAESYRAQCKLGCLGLCEHLYSSAELTQDQIGQRTRARNRIARSNSGVKEISGCCDLNLRDRHKILQYVNPRFLLGFEAEGTASPEQIDTLDALSNSTLLEITLPTRITRFNAAFPFDKRSRRLFEQRDQHDKQRAAARIGIAQVIGARSKISS